MKNQTIGIELEMAKITRAKAAEVIADYFGTTAQHTGGSYDAWEVRDTQGRTWKVMSDASIRDIPERRAEMVTPILTYADMEAYQEIVRRLRKAGAKSGPEWGCGIHCHIGRADHTARTLRNLVNLMAAKEDLISQAFQIDGSRQVQYCRKVNTGFLERLNRAKPQDLPALQRLWYNGRDESYMHYSDSRYHMLNLHATFSKGTVEFRFQNGTMHAGEIRAFILFCLALSHMAKSIKSASPKKNPTDNPKYAMRCFLLRLGFIGEEFEAPRQHLLKHLAGDSAFRYGRTA